ncbi:MAG: hypothetical protein J6C75_02565 [Oscillospiraceae bacterium]|nr:hypothetical protein [Oscillospiraceae bacterium]
MSNQQPDYKTMYLKLMYHMVEIEKIAQMALDECDKNANGSQFIYNKVTDNVKMNK